MDHKNVYIEVLSDSNVQETPSVHGNNPAHNTHKDVQPQICSNIDNASTPTQSQQIVSATGARPNEGRCKIVVLCALLVSVLCVFALPTALGIIVGK